MPEAKGAALPERIEDGTGGRTLVAVPEWTELKQRNGLDPLGMQSSSVSLYQRLMPGISNVTLRMRYYGLYAWLSRTYAERVRNTDPEVWRRWVRRAEALYALAAERAGGTNRSGVAGVNWAAVHLPLYQDFVPFADNADPGGTGRRYLKQAWGAYGAAYQSQLFEVGVLGNAQGHRIPVVAPGLGDEVAAAFGRAAGHLGDAFVAALEDGRTSRSDLDALAPLLPSNIGEDSDERDAYERLLLADTKAGAARRRTLCLALRTAELLGRPVSADDVRWTLYACAAPGGRALDCGDGTLAGHRLCWWAYQTSEMCRIACEALLKWLLDKLEQHPAGLRPVRLLEAVVDDIGVDEWPATWGALSDGLPDATDPLSTTEPTAERRLTELALQAGRGESAAPVESVRAAVELLALLHRRCQPGRATLARELGTGGPFRSVATELAFLDAHRGQGVEDVLRGLFEQRILQRHLWVAMQKLRYQGDYTFLVEADDGRLRLRAKDGPVATSPRLGTGLAFLTDVHLLGRK